MQRELLIICGPTASGKTAVAVEVCREIGGEVLSADSMQVYRGMDIGTAKPGAAEMRGIAHHLIDVAEPGEKYSAAAYRSAALQAIEGMRARGKEPVVCGGTGLYIDALTRPLGFFARGDESIRRPLEEIASLPDGKARLHAMLREIDPQSADRLHPNDVRRVVRALEVYRLTGVTLSRHRDQDQAGEGAYKARMFALAWPREELYRRIDRRVDQMMEAGLVSEVEALLKIGLDARSTALQGIGYKEIACALRGECPMDAAIDRIKQATRNYAKRQLTWFRRDQRVVWVEAEGRSALDISREIILRRGQA